MNMPLVSAVTKNITESLINDVFFSIHDICIVILPVSDSVLSFFLKKNIVYYEVTIRKDKLFSTCTLFFHHDLYSQTLPFGENCSVPLEVMVYNFSSFFYV